MPSALAIWGSVLVAGVLAGAVYPQDRTADLRLRFEHETNPVLKAKQMPELGEAEFLQIKEDVEADHLMDAVAVLRQYRDQAQSCSKALDSTGIDAEKHASGFKQLQISLQESLRRLDGHLAAMTADDQAPFLEVRKDLDEMNRHLIEELFPRREPQSKNPAKREQ